MEQFYNHINATLSQIYGNCPKMILLNMSGARDLIK